MRASTLAGAAVIIVAGAALGAIVLRDRIRLPPAATQVTSTPSAAQISTPATAAVLLVQALVTTNVYALPDRATAVMAVLPGGQRAAVTGRSQDAEWLHITTPPTSGLRGWAPAGALRIDSAALAALPIVQAQAASGATRTPTATLVGAGALSDVALSDVFLLPGGQVAVGIRNLGPGALTDATLTLSITRVGEEGGGLIGVFRIGPATLAAGAGATAVAQVPITEPGIYRLELDPGGELPDAQRANNVIETTLAPGRG